MRRVIALFDTDEQRMRYTSESIAKVLDDAHASLIRLSTESDLRQSLQCGGVDLVLLDARSCSDVNELLGIVHEIAPANTGIQTALMGVYESDLPTIPPSEFAALIPASATANEVGEGVLKAFLRVDHWRERPFIVHTRGNDRVIHPSKLSFIESNRRKICLHMGNDVIETYGKLSEILRTLPGRFVQCHKSFVVNMGYVEAFNKDSLILTTGECIPISQRRRKDTRDAFYDYVGRYL